MRIFKVLLSTWLCFSTFKVSAKENDSYFLEKEPLWVEVRSLPNKAPEIEEAIYGIRILLDDQQVHVEKKSHYKRLAYGIQNEQGVQNHARIEIEYNPAWEKLLLHHVNIQRANKKIQQLTHGSIKLLQRERNLERHLYDERLTATIILEDIRVGDIIDYAYTTTGSNPIFSDHHISTFYFQKYYPIDKQYCRLLCSKNRAIFFRHYNHKTEPKIIAHKNIKEYLWVNEIIPAIWLEDMRPEWHNPTPHTSFSDFENWEEVVKWALPLYKTSSSISIKKIASKIKEDFSLPSVRVQEAFRIAQHKIRYMGIEVGVHSHCPNPPDVVWKRRFGDCKDKSLFLCKLLREMDIEAFPALVNTRLKHMIRNENPSPYAFNHVVTLLSLGNKNIWLDPTLSPQEGSLENMYFPNYQVALVIRENEENLVNINVSPSEHFSIHVVETYIASNFTDSVILDVKTTYKNQSANYFRSYITSKNKMILRNDFINYYAKNYPEISEHKQLTINDDTIRNVLRLHEIYKIDNFWSRNLSTQERYHTFYPLLFDDVPPNPTTRIRTMPLAIAFPKHYNQTTHIHLPKKFDIEPRDISITNKYYTFRHTASIDSNHIIYTHHYESQMDAIQVEDCAEQLRQYTDITSWLYNKIHDDISTPSLKGIFLESPQKTLLLLCTFFLALFLGSILAFNQNVPRMTFRKKTSPKESGIHGILILYFLLVLLLPFFSIHKSLEHFSKPADIANWNTTGLDIFVIFNVIFSCSLAISFIFRKKQFMACWLMWSSIFLGIMFFQNSHQDIYKSQALWGFVSFYLLSLGYILFSERVSSTFTKG